MPSWNEVLTELQTCNRVDALDYVRRKYLVQLQEYTNRNVIAYYSGWLQKPGLGNADICDDDKNGLMATIHKLDRSKGLDLILHTPGGDIAATESIVDYLRKMFGNDIRAIIPQTAMSAGTMIACSCKEIIMGKQSNIGPIDPQFNGIPALGVLKEFETALAETKKDPSTIPIWQTVVAKYHPTFIGECKNAIDWSTQIVSTWLETNMFSGNPDAKESAEKVVDQLGSHEDTKTHARHIHIDEAKSFGLTIKSLETDFPDTFQDTVLTIHHAYMHTFANSVAIRIVENHIGNAIVFNIK
ncbi:MAG: ATP-dependent Clp protease proteolytic subunit [Nitrospirae bacterium]|nr:ATP-dependent Clp protease proteolytic subunit [Nitrospirota bacterium]